MSNFENSFEFNYRGIFDEAFFIKVAEELDAKLGIFVPPKFIKPIVFCAIELSQNIGHYSLERSILPESGKTYGIGSLNVSFKNNMVYLEAINMISGLQKKKITKRLSYYNTLNTDELKQLFKEKLKIESDEDSKGGGFGFIEIIRKSKNPIDFSFQNLEEEKFYMVIKLIINAGEKHE
ncbi:MAG: SiaB family protein kinase [bacterium]